MDELPLDAALAMSRAGSKVLLSDALEQAAENGVTLSAGATAKPSGSGTRIPPGPVPDDVVGVAADAGLWLIPAGENLGFCRGAIRAQLLDGRTLVDGRNLPDPSTWDAPAKPIATISAVGRSVVTDPEVRNRALQAVRGLVPHAECWAHGDTWTVLVAREMAAAVEAAVHEALC